MRVGAAELLAGRNVNPDRDLQWPSTCKVSSFGMSEKGGDPYSTVLHIISCLGALRVAGIVIGASLFGPRSFGTSVEVVISIPAGKRKKDALQFDAKKRQAVKNKASKARILK
jgi:hypothetical protein